MGREMKAFTNTPITKEKFIEHLKYHQKIDAFQQGHYGNGLDDENFKGCAVACSLRSVSLELEEKIDFSVHEDYEKYLGVPRWLAHLEDKLFEKMSTDRAKTFPLDFGEAINVGADLNKIKPAFIIYCLELVLPYSENKKK